MMNEEARAILFSWTEKNTDKKENKFVPHRWIRK